MNWHIQRGIMAVLLGCPAMTAEAQKLQQMAKHAHQGRLAQHAPADRSPVPERLPPVTSEPIRLSSRSCEPPANASSATRQGADHPHDDRDQPFPFSIQQVSDDDGESRTSDATCNWLAVAMASPFWVPMALSDGRSEYSRLLSRPFKNQENSNIDYSPATETAEWWTTRGRLEYQLTSGAEALAGDVLVETLPGFGIDVGSAHRSDRSRVGEAEFWTGDLSVTYRFAFTEWMQFRTGIGANWLCDDVDWETGLNWTYQIDVFHARRWIWSTEFDLGRIHDAGLVHWRTCVGYHYRHVEPYVGYDHYQIGAIPLDSLALGLRFWF